MARRTTIIEDRQVLAAERHRLAHQQLLAQGHDLRDLLRALYHRMQDTMPPNGSRVERKVLAVRMSVDRVPVSLRKLRNQLQAFELKHALVSSRRYLRTRLRESRSEYAEHEADAFADRVEMATYNFISRETSTYKSTLRWLQEQGLRVAALRSFTNALLEAYAAWDEDKRQ